MVTYYINYIYYNIYNFKYSITMMMCHPNLNNEFCK